MFSPRIIPRTGQRGYHVEPYLYVRDVQQENWTVAVPEIRFTYIFYIR